MKPSYKPLTAGDIRQQGDQYRESELGPKRGCYDSGTSSDLRGPGDYQPVRTLFGQAILESDLMHLNFRRPVNE